MASLRHFMQRSAALRLYRDIWRVSRHAGSDDSRDAIRSEARRQFQADRITHNSADSSTQVDFLISKGQERLSELRKMLLLTTTNNNTSPSSSSSSSSFSQPVPTMHPTDGVDLRNEIK